MNSVDKLHNRKILHPLGKFKNYTDEEARRRHPTQIEKLKHFLSLCDVWENQNLLALLGGAGEIDCSRN